MRPIKEYYYYADMFLKLSAENKFSIGKDMFILDDADLNMKDKMVEELVFTEVIRLNMTEKFSRLLLLYNKQEEDDIWEDFYGGDFSYGRIF